MPKSDNISFQELLNMIKECYIMSVDGFEKDSLSVSFKLTNSKYLWEGERYVLTFYHQQDCCEEVWLEDCEGLELVYPTRNYPLDLQVLDLKVRTEDFIPESGAEYDDESGTYTFYELETTKGTFWMRWCGVSNGYYSEEVDIKLTKTLHVYGAE